MSSLLQFDGEYKRNKHGNGVVGLEFYLIKVVQYSYACSSPYPNLPIMGFLQLEPQQVDEDNTVTNSFPVEKPHYWVTSGDRVDMEPVYCDICGEYHPRLYRAWRRPVGMLGCWVQFRYNGETHVPDLSIPIAIERLPRDASPYSDEENSRAWHRS